MKKLVYNSNTERLEVLDYDTNKVTDLLTGEDRDVSKSDYFNFIKESEKVYKKLEEENKGTSSGLDIMSLVEPIKTQLLVAVIILLVIIIVMTKSCGGDPVNEYKVYTSTDTLPANRDDVKSYISEYETRNQTIVTNWRKELIMNSVLGVKRSRAHYMVDSIADEQRVKYKR